MWGRRPQAPAKGAAAPLESHFKPRLRGLKLERPGVDYSPL